MHPLDELRDEAAGLLAERFRAQRAAEPLLPEVEDFVAHLPEEGLVATRAGTPVAYLGGAVEEDTAWIRFGGCAASEPEALRDLFAALAEGWDVSRYQVAVPASSDRIIEAFFRLAFGCQAVWAVSPLEADVAVQLQHTYVRPSTPDDLDAVAAFDQILCAHQARTPSFSGRPIPTMDELRAEWSTLWQERDHPLHVVAERDGRIVGHALLYDRPAGDLRVPAGNVDLAHVATLDDVRGTGVGLALTSYVVGWARERGYRSMTVDWRSVNLLSSRFWPNRGFRPQYLRLYRAVP
jgi:GNAT superfamily N-acetyltransferase